MTMTMQNYLKTITLLLIKYVVAAWLGSFSYIALFPQAQRDRDDIVDDGASDDDIYDFSSPYMGGGNLLSLGIDISSANVSNALFQTVNPFITDSTVLSKAPWH
jgi:hypothetical protein